MEDKIIDFQSVCRICLDKMDNMISIFEGIEAPDLISYKDMIQECASIQILTVDILPKEICIKCSEQLQLSYKLKIQCLLSEKILKNFITKTAATNNINVIKTEEDDYDEDEINDDIKIDDEPQNIDEKITVKEENFYSEIMNNNENTTTTTSDSIKCESCNESFLTQANYLRHVESCENHLYGCHLCDQVLQSQVQLKKHLLRHKKQRVRSKNEIRSKKFDQPKLEYQCTDCNKTFQFKSKLEQHMSVHSGENQYLCTYCGKSLRSGSSLRVHLRTHTNEKPYCCKICGFKSGYPLRDHLISHTNEKKYECEICKKTYARRNTLKRHVLTHSTERNFVCDICGKRFTFKHKLREHQYIHTGERKYVCTYCNKPFNRGDNLRVHLRIHTGDKPFVCSRCGRGFSAKHVLNSHLKTHTESPE